jgi:DNA polymerase-3 subunit delta'
MSFSNELMPWQHGSWAQLWSALDRLPHSLLFSGPVGLGKNRIAQRFANSLLCESPAKDGTPCGTCKSCHLLSVGNHPDFRITTIEEDASGIAVDQIRELITYLSLRPHTANRRVVILTPAEAMNINAANSLLKVLEEPPADSVLILVSHRSQLLSATIRSRCSRIEFRPPSSGDAESWLEEQGVKPDDIPDLLAAAGGAPLRAAELSQLGFAKAQEMMISDLQALQSGAGDPVECALRWKEMGAEFCLSWFSGLLADLIQTGSVPGASRHLNNPSLGKSVGLLAANSREETLFGLLDQVVESTRLAKTPLDDTLLIEDILIGWCKTGI